MSLAATAAPLGSRHAGPAAQLTPWTLCRRGSPPDRVLAASDHDACQPFVARPSSPKPRCQLLRLGSGGRLEPAAAACTCRARLAQFLRRDCRKTWHAAAYKRLRV